MISNILKSILFENYQTFNKKEIINKKHLRAINAKNKNVKYVFANEGDVYNQSCIKDKRRPNQKIIEVGRANNKTIILYDVATAGGIMRRFLIIEQKSRKSIFVYDDCVFPSVKYIQGLKEKERRCKQ